MSYLLPAKDAELIRCFLHEDRRLVACLCAAWCSSCRAWQADFLELAKNHPKDCFVWVDIEDHSDLVAEIDLETLPVLLVQDAGSVRFLGAIQANYSQVARILSHEMKGQTFPDPGLRGFLME